VTLGWFREQTKNLPDNLEMIVTVEEFNSCSTGIAFKIITPGSGAEDGKVEVYAK
jgi:hypothetical protein